MFVRRSWTNVSANPFVSSGTRLSASETKATKRPSPLIAGMSLWWFAPVPSLLTLTHSVTPGGWASATVGTNSPMTTRTMRIDRAMRSTLEYMLVLCILIFSSFLLGENKSRRGLHGPGWQGTAQQGQNDGYTTLPAPE